jgi:hypothetical protein
MAFLLAGLSYLAEPNLFCKAITILEHIQMSLL